MKARHRLCIVACICFLIALLTACGTSNGKQLVSKHFVYVGDWKSGTIYGFVSNPLSGTLKPIPGSPFSVGSFSNRCFFFPCFVVDPKNEFLFVQQSQKLQVLAIDPSNGSLTPVQAYPFTFAGEATSLEIDPMGRFVYVTASHPGGILAWSIDRKNRTLVPVANAPFGTDSLDLRAASVDPRGTFLYVAGDYAVRTYAIDGVSGALSPVGGPQTVYCGERVYEGVYSGVCESMQIFIHPSGKFGYLWTRDAYDDELLLSVNIDPQTGAISGLEGRLPISDYMYSDCRSGKCVYAGPLHLTPNGKWLFVKGYPFQYSINSSSGELALFNTLPSFTYDISSAAPTDFAVEDGFAYVIATDGDLYVYSFDQSGKAKLVTSSPVKSNMDYPVIAATH